MGCCFLDVIALIDAIAKLAYVSDGESGNKTCVRNIIDCIIHFF